VAQDAPAEPRAVTRVQARSGAGGRRHRKPPCGVACARRVRARAGAILSTC